MTPTLQQRKRKAGIRPVNRLKMLNRKERIKVKGSREQSLYQKDGYDSMMYVPTTKGSQLRKVTKKESRKYAYEL